MITVGDDSVGANNVTGVVADYPSINAAQATLGSTGTIQVIYIAAPTDTTTVTLSKSGGAPGAYVLTAHADAAVNAPTYAAMTSRARVDVTSGKGIDVPGFGWTIEKIAARTTDADSAIYLNGSAWNVVRRVVAQGGNYGIMAISNSAWVLQNSAIVGGSGAGHGVRNHASDPLTMHHVSILCTGTGLVNVDNVYATVVQSSGTCDNGGGTVGTDNVTQDSTARGSNKRTGVSGIFKDAGSTTWDLNLNGLNGGLLQGVADYSGSADTATDLNGNARPAAAGFPIDPGCAQIASGPSIMAYADGGAVVTPGSSTLTISINVPSSNCRMLVYASGRGAGVSSCDWNGTALAQIANTAKNDGTMFTEAWDLANPGTGTHNVSVVFSGSASRIWAAVVVEKYVGASAAAAVDVSGGNAAGHTTTLTTTDNDAGGIDIETEGGDSAPTPTAPSVFLGKTSSGSFNYPRLSAYRPGTAGSKTMAWSGGDVQSVVYLKPGSAGSPVTVNDVIASCAFSAVAGTATAAAAITSAAVAAAALTAVVGTAVAAAASASGIVASCAFTAITGTATAAATSASGAIAAVAFTAVEGTVDLGTSGLVSGVVATVGFAAIAGTATAAAASSSGVVALCGLQAIAGTATAAAASAAGKAADVGLAAVSGTATAAAAGASGLIAGVTFAAVAGTATTPATTVSALVAAVQLLAVAGEVSIVAPEVEPRSVGVRRAGGFRVVRAGGYRVRTP